MKDQVLLQGTPARCGGSTIVRLPDTCTFEMILILSVLLSPSVKWRVLPRDFLWFQTSLSLSLSFFFFGPFRAASMAYGDSHARGRISCTRWPIPQPQQCQICNPLREARDRTYLLMDTSQIHFCWAMTGTPISNFFANKYSWECTMFQVLGRKW